MFCCSVLVIFYYLSLGLLSLLSEDAVEIAFCFEVCFVFVVFGRENLSPATRSLLLTFHFLDDELIDERVLFFDVVGAKVMCSFILIMPSVYIPLT